MLTFQDKDIGREARIFEKEWSVLQMLWSDKTFASGL